MKTFTTTLMAFLFIVGVASAQTVYINSPASLQGAYSFEAAAFGADVTSDIWTGDAEFIDDGSGADASQGCEAAVNDLTGKIALIDRGTCEFGIKCLNAENAGAIAAIVFNNQPGNGAIAMGAGVNGGSVTIPAVMLSYEDGQAIRAILENETVNISIGALVFENDLRLGSMDVIVAPAGTYPISQILQEGDFVFTPGAAPVNFGSNEAPGFTVEATITHTPVGGASTEVYNESGTNADVIPSDSISGLVALPEFDVFDTGEGTYTVDYTVSNDSAEETPSDNNYSVNFNISESLYSKASIDEGTGRPNTTIYRTIGGGGDVEFLSIIDIPFGQGLLLDTITCDVLTNAASFADITIEGFVYQWIDADEDGFLLNEEVTLAGFATYTFPSDFAETSAELSIPVTDIISFETGVVIPDNNAKYIVGVRYFGEEQVFFGFDDSYDYNQYQNLLTENGTFSDVAYGYLVVTGWIDLSPDFEGGIGLFTALPGSALSTGITLNSPEVSTEDIVSNDVFEMSIFPNPATEVLTTKINFKQDTDFAEYRITNANGSVIFVTRDNDVLGEEQTTFNVKTLAAGQYYMTIRTEQGIQTTPFVVQH